MSLLLLPTFWLSGFVSSERYTTDCWLRLLGKPFDRRGGSIRSRERNILRTDVLLLCSSILGIFLGDLLVVVPWVSVRLLRY